MSEVKYVAITEELRDVAIQACTMNGWAEMAFAFRNAPQAEVKTRDIPHGGLVFEVITRYGLDTADSVEIDALTDRVLRAMLTKIGVETTEVVR